MSLKTTAKDQLRPAPRFFVGADVDAEIKLFVIEGNRNARRVTFEEWIEILEWVGANPGEMPIATLTRDPDVERRES